MDYNQSAQVNKDDQQNNIPEIEANEDYTSPENLTEENL